MYDHHTNACVCFIDIIQKEIEEVRLEFEDKEMTSKKVEKIPSKWLLTMHNLI